MCESRERHYERENQTQINQKTNKQTNKKQKSQQINERQPPSQYSRTITICGPSIDTPYI
jgi:hypothetical protein